MISKSSLKLIKSLQIKKFRVKEGLFLIEGSKSVLEVIQSNFKLKFIYCTNSFHDENYDLLKKHKSLIEIVKEDELKSGGTFTSNNSAIAIAYMKDPTPLNIETNEYALMLDQVKDPGNFGTIIRIADWYGIKKIICSTDTVDVYNPKVISATMGSFTRVEVFYTDLEEYIKSLPNAPNLVGTFMKGINIHSFQFPASGFIVMGNESSGISSKIESLLTEKVTIPNYGNAESLNVAIATAIVLDNMKRNS